MSNISLQAGDSWYRVSAAALKVAALLATLLRPADPADRKIRITLFMVHVLMIGHVQVPICRLRHPYPRLRWQAMPRRSPMHCRHVVFKYLV